VVGVSCIMGRFRNAEGHLFRIITTYLKISPKTMTNPQTNWSRNASGRLELSTKLSLCDVMGFVCDFLTPREFYTTFFSSKCIMSSVDHVDITRNALCNGTLAMKNTIENVYDLTLHGKIYFPSCARLTRLVNVKRCELCNCNRIKQVRPGYGIAICFHCLRCNAEEPSETYTSEIFIRPPNERHISIGLNEIISHPRVSTVLHGYYVTLRNGARVFTHCKSHYTCNAERRFMWDHHLVDDQGCRKNIGPIVTREDVYVITTMKRMEEFESYISVKLRAPPLTEYEDFNDAVRQYRHVAYKNIKRRQEESEMKKIKAAEARSAKLLKVQRWVRTLTESTHSDCRYLLRHIVNRDYVNNGPQRVRVPYRFDDAYSHLQVIHFNHPEVQILLSKYVSAPSRMVGQKKLKSARLGLYNIHRQLNNIHRPDEDEQSSEEDSLVSDEEE